MLLLRRATCHVAPRPGGHRPDGVLGQLEERAEVFEFADYTVLGGNQLVGAAGAFALALVVRPVPGRALLRGGKLGFELLARQAVALDDGARGLGGDVEAFGDLSVSELFGRQRRRKTLAEDPEQ